jgi:hypothetical protein
MKPNHVCQNLRSKSMYIPALADAPHDPQHEGRSSHCWCSCTLTETGPDDRPVGVEICSSERGCFEE